MDINERLAALEKTNGELWREIDDLKKYSDIFSSLIINELHNNLEENSNENSK
jgi:hypothetical protein